MVEKLSQMRLRELFRRENRSFLQYVNQASPWASAADHALVDKLGQMCAEELEALDALAVWMDAHSVSLPYLGSFPTNFTNFNFVAIRGLLKPLVAEQRKELADLEADANAVADPEAKKLLERLVGLNRKHLRDFEQMTQPVAA
jgi:tRNA isopentenyl-2-thiomethyl-A-37 hydroxylase MiaE